MLKTRVKVGSTINKDLYKAMQNLSKESRVPIARYFDEAIEDLLKKYNLEVVKEG